MCFEVELWMWSGSCDLGMRSVHPALARGQATLAFGQIRLCLAPTETVAVAWSRSSPQLGQVTDCNCIDDRNVRNYVVSLTTVFFVCQHTWSAPRDVKLPSVSWSPKLFLLSQFCSWWTICFSVKTAEHPRSPPLSLRGHLTKRLSISCSKAASWKRSPGHVWNFKWFRWKENKLRGRQLPSLSGHLS